MREEDEFREKEFFNNSIKRAGADFIFSYAVPLILEQILNAPKRELIKISNGEFKVYSSNGRGVLFKKDGTFKGFVERHYE